MLSSVRDRVLEYVCLLPNFSQWLQSRPIHPQLAAASKTAIGVAVLSFSPTLLIHCTDFRIPMVNLT